jgi:hypothetical protein
VKLTAVELARGHLRLEPGLQTRKEVTGGWRAVAEILNGEGQQELAANVKEFIEKMPLPRTNKEQIAIALSHRVHQPQVETNMSR